MAPRDSDAPYGSYLISETDPKGVLTSKDLSEEQQSLADGVVQFMKGSVEPATKEIEAKNLEVLTALVRQAGELGILGIDIPEEFGGLGADIVTAARVFEAIGNGGNGSYATAIGAHSGIGTWPILYFGTPAQRAEYLPRIATGEWIAAYALTEAGSGSDALAAKCKAVLEADGEHYLLNGTKVFITNAGIADVFTVFAKIDGEHNACFIVERSWPGVSIGAEEHKMGISGSSTCDLVLEDVRVPVKNLLGAPGKGHHVVMNTLNLGRFKLGAAALGAIKRLVKETVAYTAERKQFKKPLSAFGAVQDKIAEMAIAAWVGDAVQYRTAGLIEKALEGVSPGIDAAKAIKSCTAECSIVKVLLSELLSASADHAVQCLGGYGYSEEFFAARAYRDSRINRIFEGTNEINRLALVGELFGNAMGGKLDLMAAFGALDAYDGSDQDPADASGTLSDAVKRIALFLLGRTATVHMMELKKKQEFLMPIADLLIAGYACDSAVARLKKSGGSAYADAIVTSFCIDTYEESIVKAMRTLRHLYPDLEAYNAAAEALQRVATVRCGAPDSIALRKLVASTVVSSGGLPE